jgi:hypothetical protein
MRAGRRPARIEPAYVPLRSVPNIEAGLQGRVSRHYNLLLSSRTFRGRLDQALKFKARGAYG